jgi:hypothetical protein
VEKSSLSASSNVRNDLQRGRENRPSLAALAGQVLLYKARKEAALDLHSPFSTSHIKPVRQPDRPLASPFLTFLPLPLLNCGPRDGAAFFGAQQLC